MNEHAVDSVGDIGGVIGDAMHATLGFHHVVRTNGGTDSRSVGAKHCPELSSGARRQVSHGVHRRCRLRVHQTRHDGQHRGGDHWKTRDHAAFGK